MLADDSDAIRQVLRDIITIGNHEVVGESVDGDETIKKFSETKPELLLLDEPTANLDDEDKEKFEKLLKKINKEKHITVILETHNLNQAKRLSKHIYKIKNHKLTKVKQ